MNTHYSQIENNTYTHEHIEQYLNENAQLQNQLYEKNVEVSGLESVIYNLKL